MLDGPHLSHILTSQAKTALYKAYEVPVKKQTNYLYGLEFGENLSLTQTNHVPVWEEGCRGIWAKLEKIAPDLTASYRNSGSYRNISCTKSFSCFGRGVLMREFVFPRSIWTTTIRSKWEKPNLCTGLRYLQVTVGKIVFETDEIKLGLLWLLCGHLMDGHHQFAYPTCHAHVLH